MTDPGSWQVNGISKRLEEGTRAGTSQPAFRAWADVLLRLAADARLDHVPGLEHRATAAIIPSATETPDPANISRAPGQTFVALSSQSLPLFQKSAWRVTLKRHLVDRGFSRAWVEESVLPCDAPSQPMLVSDARGAVESTDLELLGEIVAFFAKDVEAYLQSWRPHPGPPAAQLAGLEVIVPTA